MVCSNPFFLTHCQRAKFSKRVLREKRAEHLASTALETTLAFQDVLMTNTDMT